MAQKFEAEVQQLDEFTYVKVAGTIDEDNDLASLSHRIRGGTAIVDLATVQDINSCGVRDWVRWREELQGRGVAVVLVECSAAIVAKLNSVSNFNDGGFIKSFYVPYYCQACEMEKAMLVEIDEFRGATPPRAPTCRCDACDGIMAFDDMEESYFAFVKQVRKIVPPATVQRLLDQLAPAAGERKILSGGATGRGSSFAGIPSTNAESRTGGSASGISVASLRRLRDKSGLRTMRKTSSGPQPELAAARRRWLLLATLSGLLLATVATVLVLLLR